MGEAKRRGSKEERVLEALAKKEAIKTETKRIAIQVQKRNSMRPTRRIGLGLIIGLALGSSAIEVKKYED